jgi:hypothetical protein
MITSNELLQQPSGLEHEFHDWRESCVWCGMTREQIEDYGERICPRRELRRECGADLS